MTEQVPASTWAHAQMAAMRPQKRGFWFSDFRFHRGRVLVEKTGADIALDATLIGEALVWFGYHLIVRVRSLLMLLARPKAPRIWFAPDRPRPWYWVWSAMAWGGMRMARSAKDADATFYFEDATWGSPARPAGVRSFNFGCPDVSKSRVAEVFGKVFGYPLALDPETFVGEAVEKGEVNGAHDGRVVTCPVKPRPGYCYQHLVDSRDGDFAYDLRTSCVGGRPVAVWIKRKPPGTRFSIHNLAVTLTAPQAVFSTHELLLIGRFCQAMKLDWGGLDILRDRNDGRIYVVDVNKTDVGPIIALPLAQKLVSTGILSAALLDMVAVP